MCLSFESRCSLTLGIMVVKDFGHEKRDGYFLPIIQRNSTIPISRVERVATVFPNQTVVRVKIYQGEGRRVEDNLFLGEFEVKGIPPGPVGQPVDVRRQRPDDGAAVFQRAAPGEVPGEGYPAKGRLQAGHPAPGGRQPDAAS